MMRIGGLASGMDIDSIVADLMKAERMPLDKLKQKKQTLEWQRDDYRAMNTLLLDFRSELTQMKLTTKYRARTASSTAEDKVSATASSAASQTSFTLKNVTQLASAAVLKNANAISVASADKIDPSKSLHSQNSKALNQLTWSAGIIESKTFTVPGDKTTELSLDGLNAIDPKALNVKVDGKVFKVNQTGSPAEGEVYLDVDNDKLVFGGEGLKKGANVSAQFVAENKTDTATLGESAKAWQLSRGSIHSVETVKINGTEFTVANAGDVFDITDGTDVIGSINKETGKVTFVEEQAKDTKIEVTYKQNYTSFTLGAHTAKGEAVETFLVAGSQSLNSVIDKVNNSGVGLNMFYDAHSDQLTLTRKETGDFNDGGSEFIKSGPFVNSFLRFWNSDETDGKNAVFTINGLETQRTSNTFEINGVTMTLKSLTETNEEVNITVGNDSNKVFDNIKEFVDKYNELIDKISKKTSEDSYRSYKPLTDEQKEQLSDKQQEQWVEKAKSGLLKRDPILTGVLSQMRSDFYAPVSNDKVSSTFSQLASIGITTSPNYLEGGKLIINEAELKKAIEADPESVENLFRGDGTSYNQKGIAQRLYDSVGTAMDKLKSKAGNSFSTNQQFALGRELTNVDSSIDRFEVRMKQVEDRYWRQFTAMEKAIQQSNQQSMYLMQQFGGM
jgi:flagellar hook-associated protein 2